MRLIRGLYNLPKDHTGCVATIGNFDGLHRGHQQVLDRVKAEAKRLSLPATVISFEPLPREYFAPNNTPPRLTRLREKVLHLQDYGVDDFFMMRFTSAIAQQSPQDFIQQVLIDGLNVRYLVVGDDFKFGKDRAGDFELLKAAGEQHGFDVVDTRTVMSARDDERISSTRIRTALTAGDMHTATRLLGRPYTMMGRVVHGEKRGREMGYPTANIAIHRKQTPISGIFVVRMHGLSQGAADGVASLGVRPTFEGDGKALLEVHLFDFNQQIYGEYVEVEFLHKIRDEEKFNSLDELVTKIHSDAAKARAWFAVND